METETAVRLDSEPPRLSVVTATIRSEYAEAIYKIIDRVAAMRGARSDVSRQVQAKMLHKLIHWICRRGTHFLDTEAMVDRLERLAERLVDRELRRREKERLRYGLEPLDDVETRRILGETRGGRRRIHVGILIKVWNQLSYPEQRVLRLGDIGYDIGDIALILDVSENAAEFYLNQARQKIHQAYLDPC